MNLVLPRTVTVTAMLYLDILFILLLTLINGVLAMSELAVVSSRRARLVGMADRGNRGARVALRLLGDPGRFLSTVQIGITLVGILAGAVSGATIAERLGAWLDTLPLLAPNGVAIAIGLVVLCITYLSLIVGELVPKRIAMNDPERVASAVAQPMNLLSRIAAPAVWLLKASTEAVLRALGLNEPKQSTVTEDEVKSLIAEGTEAGVFVPPCDARTARGWSTGRCRSMSSRIGWGCATWPRSDGSTPSPASSCITSAACRPPARPSTTRAPASRSSTWTAGASTRSS